MTSVMISDKCTVLFTVQAYENNKPLPRWESGLHQNIGGGIEAPDLTSFCMKLKMSKKQTNWPLLWEQLWWTHSPLARGQTCKFSSLRVLTQCFMSDSS